MNPQYLLNNVDIEKIATEGGAIYQTVKKDYESEELKGKFLAIDIDSKDTYIAPTSAEAVEAARQVHPGKVFYVVKVGFDAAETLANLLATR